VAHKAVLTGPTVCKKSCGEWLDIAQPLSVAFWTNCKLHKLFQVTDWVQPTMMEVKWNYIGKRIKQQKI
jgi:hypothetical protein